MSATLIPSTSSDLTLREMARVERESRDQAYAAEQAARREEKLKQKGETLAHLLMMWFHVEADYVVIEEGDDPQAHVQDLVFALRDRPHASDYGDRERLHVATTCSRGCGLPAP
jgi:hypothetical protein